MKPNSPKYCRDEELVKQQAMFDREQEKAEQDRESTTHELEEIKMPKRPAPHTDHDPPEHLSTASIAREAHCYRGYKWRAVSKSEAS